jgi:hypothetical protein
VRNPSLHAAHGITALFDALRRKKHGYSLGAFRVYSNRLALADIEIKSMRGHKDTSIKYGQMDKNKPCRVLIVDAGMYNRIYMDVDSLAFLLDAAIASNPSHFLRKTQASKDTDD